MICGIDPPMASSSIVLLGFGYLKFSKLEGHKNLAKSPRCSLFSMFQNKGEICQIFEACLETSIKIQISQRKFTI